jgi:hypothetical protein
LALCQRYYQLIRAASGVAVSATAAVFSVQPSGELRAGPTLGQTGVISFSNFSTDYQQSATGLTTYTAYTNLVILGLSNVSGLASGTTLFFRGNNTNAITLSSEL